MNAWYLWETKEGDRYAGTRDIDGCEALCRHWELKSESLRKAVSVFLNRESVVLRVWFSNASLVS